MKIYMSNLFGENNGNLCCLQIKFGCLQIDKHFCIKKAGKTRLCHYAAISAKASCKISGYKSLNS